MKGTLIDKIESMPIGSKLMYQKEWYLEQLFQEGYGKLLKESANLSVQRKVLLQIQMRYLVNMNGDNKEVLNEAEYKIFLSIVSKLLEKISVQVILEKTYSYSVEEEVLRKHFLKLKKVDLKREYQKYSNSFDKILCCIKTMQKNKNSIHIDAEIENVVFLQHELIKVIAISQEHTYDIIPTMIYSDVEFFGKSFYRGYMCQVEIPLDTLNHQDEINVQFHYEDKKFILPITFESIYSKLYEKFTASYWRCSDRYIMYDRKKRALIVDRATKKKLLYRELKFLSTTLFQSKSIIRSIKSIVLRLLYWCLKPLFQKKQIWITYDQLYKGGDNGQYFYEYAASLEDEEDIEIYYIIRNDTEEYKMLSSRWNTVVAYNSVKHKLLSLYANVIFTTRTDVDLCCGFWSGLEKYVRDLFDCNVVCLQHGVTIQDMAKHQNRLKDNISMYCCVSEVEVQNLMKPEYGYQLEQLVLTGAPRYDGLVNRSTKKIIISPTWRKNFIKEDNKKGHLHNYSPLFKDTLYYQIYNELINNTRLLKVARENGYQIIFLLHPVLSPQMKDFKYSKEVKVTTGIDIESYEKILTEANILITDYSGIQFDFAYMKKPVIYFQPKELPPQYGNGGMNYEKDGFGKVCYNEMELIDKIAYYIDNDCLMEEEYKKNVDKFFYYSDRENSKRIYEISKKRFFVDNIFKE